MTKYVPGSELINGVSHIRDSQGRWQPVSTMKPQDVLQHELVHKIIGFADELSAQIARFKGHCFEDVNSFLELLAQEYGATRGGKEGNMTLTSHDGTLKVEIQNAKHFDYGPELQLAKELIDACLSEMAEDAPPLLWSIVNDAFSVDQKGKISRANLLRLKKHEHDDPRWQRAKQAITDAERAVGSKTYMRFYRRPSPEENWQAISIDMAKV